MNEQKSAPVIEKNAFFKLSYGLFLLTAKAGDRENGCIVNTAIQAADDPKKLTVAVNKQNYTCGLIAEGGVFNVSVLTEQAPYAVFQRYGMRSGRDTDKFAGEPELRTENGLRYLESCANAVFGCRVTGSLDCGSHTLFLGEVTEARTLSDIPSATYAYYFAHIKPKPAPAPSLSDGRRWVCRICGFVYDEAAGLPEQGIAPGTAFEALPEGFLCPLCKHGKSDFELLAPAAPAAEKPLYRKYTCDICGYVYDEEKGLPEQGIAPGTRFEALPADFRCPLCGAGREQFRQQG